MFEFVLTFLLSLLLIRVVQHIAPRIGLLDIPNERSMHRNHTPRGAGIGFFFAAVLTLPLFHFDLLLTYNWTFLAICLVFIVGIMDDHRNTSPNTKFVVIIVSTLLLYLNDIVISDIGFFLGFHLTLGWLALPFTLFAVVAFTNALNLIDGLDGLAGSISLVILITLFTIGYQNQDTFMIALAGTFIAGLLAFLLFNWHPASIFMGDSGSLTLGFVIALLSIKSLSYIPAISILFIAAIPIIDTTVVVIRRKRTGRKLFSADRCHLHHILRHFFAEDTQKTVLFLALFQAVYSITGLQFTRGHDSAVLLILFLLNIFIVYLFISAMIRRQNRNC